MDFANPPSHQSNQHQSVSSRESGCDLPSTFGAAKIQKVALSRSPSKPSNVPSATASSYAESTFNPLENDDFGFAGCELDELAYLEEVFDNVEVALRSYCTEKQRADRPTEPSIFVADIPHHISLQPLQDMLFASAREKGLTFKVINCQPGQARFTHFQALIQDIFKIREGEGAASAVDEHSEAHRTLSDADFVIVDNANEMLLEHWTRLLRITAHVREKQGIYQLPVFLLVGAHGSTTQDPETARLTHSDVLPTATYHYFSNEYNNEHVEAHFDCNLDRTLAGAAIPSASNPGCHVDNFLYLQTGGMNVKRKIDRLVSRAKMKFPGRNEVVLLSCYETFSFNMPDALNIWDFLAFGSERASPDLVPKTRSNKMKKEYEK
jgi:hypothetical protein